MDRQTWGLRRNIRLQLSVNSEILPCAWYASCVPQFSNYCVEKGVSKHLGVSSASKHRILFTTQLATQGALWYHSSQDCGPEPRNNYTVYKHKGAQILFYNQMIMDYIFKKGQTEWTDWSILTSQRPNLPTSWDGNRISLSWSLPLSLVWLH